MTVSPPYDGMAFLHAAMLGCEDQCPGEVSFVSASQNRGCVALSFRDTRIRLDMVYLQFPKQVQSVKECCEFSGVCTLRSAVQSGQKFFWSDSSQIGVCFRYQGFQNWTRNAKETALHTTGTSRSAEWGRPRPASRARTRRLVIALTIKMSMAPITNHQSIIDRGSRD